jgi:ubiquinone/menaquinone biosynthesis C-methylase UbiE
VSVHRAARFFDTVADSYDRVRPHFPQAAIDWIVQSLDLQPGRDVLDLAAGTGRLTTELARTGARVIAVDPAPKMLDYIRRALPDVEVHEGTAQEIPLPDGAVDAVTVAQAFHWFASEEALAEIHRVLRPDGRLLIAWNRRDTDAEVHAEISRIIAPYQGDAPRHRSGAWREVMASTPRFAPDGHEEIPFEQRLDIPALVDRVQSTSFIAALPDDERAGVLAEVDELGRRLGEPIVLPHTSELYAYSRLPCAAGGHEL